MSGTFTATERARRSNGGCACGPPAIDTSAAAGVRADTRPASKSGVRAMRNAAFSVK